MKIYTWVDQTRSLDHSNDDFLNQFTRLSNAINELTTQALLNGVPMSMSRDITELRNVILRCKRDCAKNFDPQNDRPSL